MSSSTPDEHAQPHEVNGMDGEGWSNSPAAKNAPEDVIPEVAPPADVEPGFSNAKAVRGDASVKAEKAADEAAPKKSAKSDAKKKG